MSGARTVASMGITVAPPAGWEAIIYQRPPDPGEVTYPIMHAATIPIPVVRGDYGGGLVEMLGPSDVFIGLLEFGPAAAGTALYQTLNAIPGLTPNVFSPRQLQRFIAGQAGVQRFFSVSGRAFCMYAVIGSVVNQVALTARANQLIGTLRVSGQA
jgi:hypothetical protein